MATKTFNTRDAATAFLRKQGIDKSLYNSFISNVRGQLTIDLLKLDLHLNPKAPAVKEPTRLKPETEKLAPKAEKSPRSLPPTADPVAKPTRVKPVKGYGSGLAAQIRELICTTTMTNDEIFRHLNLDADKKTYPGWYRGQLARKAAAAK